MMNNEEKILAKLEAIDNRITVMQEDIAQLKEDVAELKEDMSEVKEDVAELREDAVITRDICNQLLGCWTEKFGEIELVQAVPYA